MLGFAAFVIELNSREIQRCGGGCCLPSTPWRRRRGDVGAKEGEIQCSFLLRQGVYTANLFYGKFN
jgi:hypothetical protein